MRWCPFVKFWDLKPPRPKIKVNPFTQEKQTVMEPPCLEIYLYLAEKEDEDCASRCFGQGCKYWDGSKCKFEDISAKIIANKVAALAKHYKNQGIEVKIFKDYL